MLQLPDPIGKSIFRGRCRKVGGDAGFVALARNPPYVIARISRLVLPAHIRPRKERAAMTDDASHSEDKRRRIASEALPVVMQFGQFVAGEAALAAQRMDIGALLGCAIMGICFAQLAILTLRMKAGLLRPLEPRAPRTASSETSDRSRHTGARRESSDQPAAPAEAADPGALRAHASVRPAPSWLALAASVPGAPRASVRQWLRARAAPRRSDAGRIFFETLFRRAFARPIRYVIVTYVLSPRRRRHCSPVRILSQAEPATGIPTRAPTRCTSPGGDRHCEPRRGAAIQGKRRAAARRFAPRNDENV